MRWIPVQHDERVFCGTETVSRIWRYNSCLSVRKPRGGLYSLVRFVDGAVTEVVKEVMLEFSKEDM